MQERSQTVFSIVPIEMAMDSRLTKMQLRVLIALLSFRSKNSNTMWPKRETLAERCGYNVRTISRVTTELVALGWLQKEGSGGHSKPSEYRFTVPELSRVLGEETVTDPGTVTPPATPAEAEAPGPTLTVPEPGIVNPPCTVPEPETVTEPETVSEPGTTTVTGSGTKRSPDRTGAKNLPGTNQGTDQKIYGDLDFASWPEKPSPQVFKDWKTHRRQKRASVTQTVINQMGRHLWRAHGAGYSVDYCLAVQQEAGWQGFNFEWLIKREVQNGQGIRPDQPARLSRTERVNRALDEAFGPEPIELDAQDYGRAY